MSSCMWPLLEIVGEDESVFGLQKSDFIGTQYDASAANPISVIEMLKQSKLNREELQKRIADEDGQDGLEGGLQGGVQS